MLNVAACSKPSLPMPMTAVRKTDASAITAAGHSPQSFATHRRTFAPVPSPVCNRVDGSFDLIHELQDETEEEELNAGNEQQRKEKKARWRGGQARQGKPFLPRHNGKIREGKKNEPDSHRIENPNVVTGSQQDHRQCVKYIFWDRAHHSGFPVLPHAPGARQFDDTK